MFARDALLLIGHGSSRQADAARPLLAHAEVIRATGRFAEVAVGMLLGEPAVVPAFQALTSQVVHILPFFLEDGYFTRVAIPDLLLPLTPDTRVTRFCPPIGSHAGVARMLQARFARHADMYGTNPRFLSVVTAGHGSARDPGRARNLRRHAAALESSGLFGWVRVAYLEEPPLIAETLANGRGHVTAVLGYLINEGNHAVRDLPALIAAERVMRDTTWPPVYDLGTIASDEGLPGLIVDLVTQTA